MTERLFWDAVGSQTMTPPKPQRERLPGIDAPNFASDLYANFYSDAENIAISSFELEVKRSKSADLIAGIRQYKEKIYIYLPVYQVNSIPIPISIEITPFELNSRSQISLFCPALTQKGQIIYKSGRNGGILFVERTLETIYLNSSIECRSHFELNYISLDLL
jgi:hypothetical protein